LAAMGERSFVVATAYIKTEPIQVALFGLVFLGDRLTPLASAAVMIATCGVVAMAWPRPAAPADGPGTQALGGLLRPALYGVGSGALLALASVGFRGAILALGEGSFVLHATITLATNLLLQTLTLSGWLLLRDPAVLKAVIAAWRPSVPAGFAGAAASQMWFLAFALEAAARVRTLALVEILFAQVLSRRVFAQSTSGREKAGIGLVMLGVVLLLMAG
ncbi:MAG TPA: EamA/RhaT family transporter, partial [Burkholderiaceae bacterium]|nr:EamA/RhaT family transporter [Burkholderiaceae bacterium]